MVNPQCQVSVFVLIEDVEQLNLSVFRKAFVRFKELKDGIPAKTKKRISYE